MRIWRIYLLASLLLGEPLFATEPLTVAVASNFSSTASEISAAFTARTNIAVRFSVGSTGKLYAQIVNGAPYDLFLAADAERPLRLQESQLVVPGSRRPYASGSLVLWSADPELKNRNCRESLQTGSFRRIAIANPATAPYGRAAQEFLESYDLKRIVEARLVYGENIAQAMQFVATGNATFGIVAKSLTVNANLPPATCSWDIPASSHSPVEQQLVILKRTAQIEAARKFSDFLHSAAAIAILQKNGYYSVSP